jgi:chromosome segregation ATPase
MINALAKRWRGRAWVARVLAAVVAVTFFGPPADAAERKKKQSDAAREAMDKQKEIARGLKEKATSDPVALQKQLDELKAQLQTEKDRHAAATEPLNKELKTYADAGDRKRASRTQKSLDKANDSHKDKVASLEKKIADLQAKLDASKPK